MYSVIVKKIDIPRYIPRGGPIKIFDFFYLKNFDPKFRFHENLRVARWPGFLLHSCLHKARLRARGEFCLILLLFLNNYFAQTF